MRILGGSLEKLKIIGFKDALLKKENKPTGKMSAFVAMI